jgi:NTE family protein
VDDPDERVAVVLAGGGARGAYEAGALSVLLPELERRGQRPRLVIGTSAGALNASFLAANAHLPSAQLARQALAVWESIGWTEVLDPLLSAGSLLRLSQYAGEVLRIPGLRLESLLDPAPLGASLRDRVDFEQLQRNIAAGRLHMAGVVATSALTNRSVVFHAGQPSPPSDHRRGLDYVAAELSAQHVLASAAIPALFPAVEVTTPRAARGWYLDGGTRLNTPIKPALAFGATHIVVVALSSLAPGPRALASEQRPDALVGAGQILGGLLDDQLTADLQTLVTINGLTRNTAVVPSRKRRVPYVVVAPRGRDTIAERALAVLRKHYRTPAQRFRSPNVAALAQLLAGDADVQHADLVSFLLFTPEFMHSLIEVGRADARRWLRQSHDLDGFWQVGRL